MNIQNPSKFLLFYTQIHQYPFNDYNTHTEKNTKAQTHAHTYTHKHLHTHKCIHTH